MIVPRGTKKGTVMKTHIVAIREKNTHNYRNMCLVDGLDHYLRELKVAIKNRGCSPAYVHFPDDYEAVALEINPMDFSTLAGLRDLMPPATKNEGK